MGQKISFRKRLRHKFRLTIINDTTYEMIFRIRLSLMHVIIGIGVLSLILVLVTSYLIAFTSIRNWIPGYPDSSFRTEMLETALRVDSIQSELDKRDNFIRSLQIMIGGGEYGIEESDTTNLEEVADANGYDTIMLRLTEEERAFRTELEDEERFSLGLGIKPTNKEYYHFYSPVSNGYVVSPFNEKEKHYGIDVVTKSEAPVMAILDGVVVFTDWTINTGHVVAIQHANNLMSIYKHNSILLCKQGDYVRTGQVIANVGNSGKETSGPHLHFEMWRAGNPLNPEDFIQFK